MIRRPPRSTLFPYTTLFRSASAHTAAVLFQQLTGTSVLLVPYRGGAPAMQDLIAGPTHLPGHQTPAATASDLNRTPRNSTHHNLTLSHLSRIYHIAPTPPRP